jgi:hypothetical protein
MRYVNDMMRDSGWALCLLSVLLGGWCCSSLSGGANECEVSETRCNGEEAINCAYVSGGKGSLNGHNVFSQQACASEGLSCVVSNGEALCVHSKEPYDPQTYTKSCTTSGLPVTCEQGFPSTRYPCAEGNSCFNGLCSAANEVCSITTYKPTCDEKNVMYCDEFAPGIQLVVRETCAPLNPCAETATTAGCVYQGVDTLCDPNTFQERCDGNNWIRCLSVAYAMGSNTFASEPRVIAYPRETCEESSDNPPFISCVGL